MAKKTIRIYNDSVLRRKARPVKQVSGTIQKLVKDMFETMYEEGGIGLAAPQVGVSRRLFVVDTREMGQKLALINPRIVTFSKKDREAYKEGCLSVPGIEVEVLRPRRITVEYTDLDGQPVTLEAEEMLARVIQHENDHLDGILIVDRAGTTEECEKLRREMDQLEAEAHA